MKYLIVFVIVAFVEYVTTDEEWKPALGDEAHRRIQENCIKDSGLSKDQMNRVSNVDLLDEKEFHEYVLCHVKKIGIFTEESGFNADRVIAQLAALNQTSEKAVTSARECLNASEENETPAVRAFRFIVCMIKNIKRVE